MNLKDKNKSWIERNKFWIKKTAFVIVIILITIFIMETISSITYVLLPIWFLFLEGSYIAFIKFRQLSFMHLVLYSHFISLVLTIFFTIIIAKFYNLQDLENNYAYIFLSLSSSVAGILSTYSEASKNSTKTKK